MSLPPSAATWLVAGATCALGACGSCEPSQPTMDQAPPPSSGIPAAASTPPPIHGPLPRAGMHPSCRAMAVEGDVRETAAGPGDSARDGGTGDAGDSVALGLQDRVVGERWVELADGAHLVVREPRTARETSYRGPGRARICVDAQEEAWLPLGDFESSPGSGEGPGAEQWVVTPLGVVRYAGSAKVVVEARPRGVSLAVSDGAAFLWPAQDATVGGPNGGGGMSEGWARVISGRVALAPRSQGSAVAAARAAVMQCTQLAERARSLAAALLEKRQDAPPPGDPAEQVRTRRIARAACAVAHLRAASLSGTAASLEALSGALRQADSAWHELPIDSEGESAGVVPARRPQGEGREGERAMPAQAPE